MTVTRAADTEWLGDELRLMRTRAEADGRWRDVAVISGIYAFGVLGAPAQASTSASSPPPAAQGRKRGRRPRTERTETPPAWSVKNGERLRFEDHSDACPCPRHPSCALVDGHSGDCEEPGGELIPEAAQASAGGEGGGSAP